MHRCRDCGKPIARRIVVGTAVCADCIHKYVSLKDAAILAPRIKKEVMINFKLPKGRS